ncbi:MAG: phosphatidylinositol-specific phospholipase C domain-containing protein, partial [Pseudomonadota bacterium]
MNVLNRIQESQTTQTSWWNRLLLATCLVMMGVFSLAASAHNDNAYAYETSLGISHPDWMSGLPNEMRLSDMSLVMTHDTMTYSIDDGGAQGTSPVTQQMSLQTQLDSGIRAFDIRLRWIPSEAKFRIYHGLDDTGFYFERDVLNVFETFLDQHPTETIVMSILHEWEAQLADDTIHLGFNNLLSNIISNHANSFWNGTGINPTLGETRGKIIMVRKFTDSVNGTSFSYPGIQWDDFDSYLDYSFPDSAEGLSAKWQGVKKHLNKVAAGSGNTLYVTNLNMAFVGSKPWFSASGHAEKWTDSDHSIVGFAIANNRFTDGFGRATCPFPLLPDCIYFLGMNNLTLTHIMADAMQETYRTGILNVDFPGGQFIEVMIELNYDRAEVLDTRSDNIVWRYTPSGQYHLWHMDNGVHQSGVDTN